MKTKGTIVIVIIILVIIGIIYLTTRRSAPTPATSTSSSSGIVVAPETLSLLSPTFTEGQSIPSIYTCDGVGTLPPLSWKSAPVGTQSFAITLYDPDVPKKVKPEGYFDHWVIFNIPVTSVGLNASSTEGILGNNGTGKTGYIGACPPKEYEPKNHRYIFTLYALDSMLDLKKGATRSDVEKAVVGHTLASTTLTGMYQKKLGSE